MAPNNNEYNDFLADLARLCLKHTSQGVDMREIIYGLVYHLGGVLYSSTASLSSEERDAALEKFLPAIKQAVIMAEEQFKQSMQDPEQMRIAKEYMEKRHKALKEKQEKGGNGFGEYIQER